MADKICRAMADRRECRGEPNAGHGSAQSIDGQRRLARCACSAGLNFDPCCFFGLCLLRNAHRALPIRAGGSGQP